MPLNSTVMDDRIFLDLGPMIHVRMMSGIQVARVSDGDVEFRKSANVGKQMRIENVAHRPLLLERTQASIWKQQEVVNVM